MKKIILIIFGLLSSFKVFSQGADCASATQLTNVSNYCSGAAAYSNSGASSEGLSLPACFTSTATEDVWFSFTAIGSDVLISVAGTGAGGTMDRPRIAIYTGDCTTGLTNFACANGTTTSDVTQLYQSALLQGAVYYIRISTTSGGEGSFELCVNNYTPPPNPGADCGGASFLCNKNSVSVSSLSGGGTNTDEPESTTCLEESFGADEGNSSWFYWTCDAAGSITFDITPVNPDDDIDFLFYRLNTTNVCGTRTPLRCNSSSCLNANGSTGLNLTDTDLEEDPSCDFGENSYCQFVNMTAGSSYALLVNNWSGNTGFTINFGGTGTFAGPKPIITTDVTSICQGGNVIFDGSTSTNVPNGLNWNFNNGGSPTSATGIGPHTINYANAGNYTAILNGVNAAGCITTVTKNIVVNNPPNPPTVSNVTKCLNAPVASLSATGTNLLWYTSSTGGVGSATAPTPSTTSVGTTSYFVSQTVSGCESTRNQIDFTVVDNPSVSVNSESICSGQTATLIVSSTSNPTFSWLPTTNINTSSGASVIATPPIGTTSLTYTVTATLNGCTATAIATVSVTNNTSITVNSETICSGLSATLSTAATGTITWSPATGLSATTGASVTANPTVTTVYTIVSTSAGCTATGTATVTVNPKPTINAGLDATVCLGSSATISANGAFTYSWNADPSLSSTTSASPTITPTVSTTYFVTGTDINGCTGTDNVFITVPPTFTLTPTASNATCFGVCNGEVSVAAIPSTGPFALYTYVWNTGSTLQIINGLCANTYTVEGRDGASCMQSATVTIAQPTPLTIVETSNTPVLCTGDNTGTASVTATGGTSPYNYFWSPIGTTTSSNNLLAAGVYTVSATDVNACTSSTTVTITEPQAIVINPVAETTICINQSTNLIASATGGSAPYSYAWTEGVNTFTGSNISVNPTITTSYTVSVIDGNNCLATNTQSVTVTINPLLNMNTILPSVICDGAFKIVDVSGNGGNGIHTFTWSPMNGVTVMNASGSSVKLNPAITTNYTVTITDNCGTPSDNTNFIFTVTPKPILTISPTTASGCEPLSVNFTGTSTNAIAQCYWDFGDNGNSYNCAPSRTFGQDGNYNVTYNVTDINGCTNFITSSVNVHPVPTAVFSATPQPTTIIDPEITFTNITEANVANQTWIFNDSLGTTSSLPTPSYIYPAPGEYLVTLAVETDRGCVDTTTQPVIISEYFVVYVPNAFSPDNDGYNDTFTAFGTGITNFKMGIYDRWGGKIIETDDIVKGWDGKKSNEKVEKGVYIYRMEVVNFLGEKKVLSGHVTVVR